MDVKGFFGLKKSELTSFKSIHLALLWLLSAILQNVKYIRQHFVCKEMFTKNLNLYTVDSESGDTYYIGLM